MFRFILIILAIIFLASIIRCDETNCDLTCGQGKKVRKVLYKTFNSKDIKKDIKEQLKD